MTYRQPLSLSLSQPQKTCSKDRIGEGKKKLAQWDKLTEHKILLCLISHQSASFLLAFPFEKTTGKGKAEHHFC